MASSELLPVRPFPQIEHRRRLASDFLRAVYGRTLNNRLGFGLINRRFVRGLRQLDPPPLTAAGERVADDLRANGIAVADFSEFFDAEFYEQIKGAFADHLDAFNATKPSRAKGKAVYLDTIHKSHTFVPDDPVSAYGASPAYAAVAARYMGMVPRFVGSSFWHTRPAPDDERIFSQQWHRDYNDRRLVKVFLYLTDVGPEHGPVEFVAGSHIGGPVGGSFDRIGSDGYRAYPNGATVADFVGSVPVVRLDDVPTDRRSGEAAPWHRTVSVVQCVAPQGALIFADTFGLHCGGHVVSEHRDMIMLTYSTNFNVHKPHFAVTSAFADTLTPFMKMAFGVA